MIKDLHEKLKKREITSVQLTEDYLQRIKERDGEIGAYLLVMREEALKQAAVVDKKFEAGEELDVLSGIPCAIKDNICFQGVRTTAASKMLEHYMPPYDATAITRLKTAEAVFLGKANLDEFAMGSSTETSAYHATKNPVDTTRVPGGTSGGSAAAVAGEMAVYALGSDTGGSIRQPASFCGLVGLKPTYGRVSRHGLLAMTSSFDQIGPLTKTVEDAAIVLSCIAGEDKMDATTAESGGKEYEDYLNGDITGVKIGVAEEFLSDDLDPQVRAVTEAALEEFKKLGATVEMISMPEIKFALPVYYIIMPAEVSSNMARYDGIKYGLSQSEGEPIEEASGLLATYMRTRADGLGAEVKRRIMLGTYALSAGYYDAYYKKASAVRLLIRQAFERVFEKVDVIFSPTAPEAAFKLGAKTDDSLKMYLSDIYTVTANLAGVPAISFSIGTIEEEGKTLPLGGQLMGKWFDEEVILRAADAYERFAFS